MKPNYYDEKRRASVEAYCDVELLTPVERCIQLEDLRDSLLGEVKQLKERIEKMVGANREWQRRRTAEQGEVIERQAQTILRLVEERAQREEQILRLAWYGDIMSLMLVEGTQPEQDDYETPWKMDHIDGRGEMEYDSWTEMLRAVAEQHGIRKPEGVE